MRYITPEQKKAHRDSKRKYRAEHREERREYMKKWKSEHNELYTGYHRKYKDVDINCSGLTKNHIRVRSNKLLFRTHSKLPDYQIHHCFGYEDPNRFIYIPKTLHRKIHELLKDNNIPSDSNHWNTIRDLVNTCEEYTYIRT